jgi:hypothetical protein
MAGRRFTNLDIAMVGRERNRKAEGIRADGTEHLSMPILLTNPR